MSRRFATRGSCFSYFCNFLIIFCSNRHRSLPEIISTSPNTIRDDIKRLKLIELQLNDEVKGLAHQRDGLVMELQQLQEAKPVLERAYAVINHLNHDIFNQFWLFSSTIMFVFFPFFLS